MSSPPLAAVDVDDCWNRIGVRGDSSCRELVAHTHCRNCEVYSHAARRLLNVPLPSDHVDEWTGHFAQPLVERKRITESALLFRAGEEWFGLPTTACVEVTGQRAAHTLPHRRSEAVCGLVNLRGELVVCISLTALLGVAATRAAATGRLLIIGEVHERTALQVNEVAGTHSFAAGDLDRVPQVLAGSQHIRATLRWRDRTVGLLDAGALLASVRRCLA